MHIKDSEIAIPTPIVNDQDFKRYRRSTCPPYINYQLDYMINQLIDRHRKTVLKGLKSLIFGGKKINRWYEAFLLIYLLLSTLEFAYQHQLGYTTETVGTVSSQLGTIVDIHDNNDYSRVHTATSTTLQGPTLQNGSTQPVY